MTMNDIITKEETAAVLSVAGKAGKFVLVGGWLAYQLAKQKLQEMEEREARKVSVKSTTSPYNGIGLMFTKNEVDWDAF